MSNIAVVARVRVHEGKRDEFLASFKPLLEHARQEPGTLLYVLHQSKDDPNVFWTSEVYADEAALEAHSKGEIHQSLRPTFAEQMGEPEVMWGEALMGKGLD
jgi:autoinducer 2-degrading protein